MQVGKFSNLVKGHQFNQVFYELYAEGYAICPIQQYANTRNIRRCKGIVFNFLETINFSLNKSAAKSPRCRHIFKMGRVEDAGNQRKFY